MQTAHKRGVTNEQHNFSTVPSVQMQRSQFNRSHGVKTTFDAGFIVPIFLDEALPGDTMNLKTTAFARLATPIFPIMDNMFMDFFFFAVPNRLLWDNWEKFCGAQEDPGDSTDFTVPVCTNAANGAGYVGGYFGLPQNSTAPTVNALPFRAYNLIYNEWFRDENLQDSITFSTTDGPDATSGYQVLRRRGKRHDYFTSCLPFTQKGDPVSLPLGTVAPVVGTGDLEPVFTNTNWSGDQQLAGNSSGTSVQWDGAGAPGTVDIAQWEDTKLEADLSAATAATINDIRQAFQIQKLLERDARGGTRYTEIVRSHFGVMSPDQRLQRPEYLGGGTTRVNIHPVSATSGYSTAPDVGTLSGFGTAIADGIGFVKSFTEHCVIIGLVSVRADLTYQQGLDRMWSRSTRYDYYWPSLAHIGEQAVLLKEIYHVDNPTLDDVVFGYQERYAEYRYKPSRCTGKMSSDASGTLEAWHLALDFTSPPLLNAAFIEDDPPLDRCIAVSGEPHFIGDFFFNYKCARPMPTFSVPGLVDHF